MFLGRVLLRKDLENRRSLAFGILRILGVLEQFCFLPILVYHFFLAIFIILNNKIQDIQSIDNPLKSSYVVVLHVGCGYRDRGESISTTSLDRLIFNLNCSIYNDNLMQYHTIPLFLRMGEEIHDNDIHILVILENIFKNL